MLRTKKIVTLHITPTHCSTQITDSLYEAIGTLTKDRFLKHNILQSESPWCRLVIFSCTIPAVLNRGSVGPQGVPEIYFIQSQNNCKH
jgi:hypothetical protein